MTSVDPDARRLGLLGTTSPESLVIRVLILQPGSKRVFDEREWRDSLVEVERGELEVQLRGGTRLGYVTGDVLWLVGLPVLALYNPGLERAVLVAASRGTIQRSEV
jgi:hypothetical protein